jgi:hypothetical protein
MKSHSPRQARLEGPSAVRQREVEREMENFLRALTSYPDRFARDPDLSFQQHLFSVAARRPAVGEERRRG